MENKRLKSYDFKCPCCSEPHRRLFEYYGKYYGLIPEVEGIPEDKEVTLLERVVMHDETTFEGSRSIGIGDSVFRCGNCYEYFKFADTYSLPDKLTPSEKEEAEKKFKPITVLKNGAVMNAVASFDALINKCGCVYDENTNQIVIRDGKGREFRLDIADQLFEAFYGNNPMFDVKSSASWGLEKQAQKEQ